MAVDYAECGESAWSLASVNSYDVIILDLMLPKLDGLTVLKRLRDQGNRSCILILSARDQIQDRVAGLEAGADDYLIKPFALQELLARVRTLIRRKYDANNPILTVGDLTIDTVRQTVWRGERNIDLTAREYTLLEYLAFRAGQLVSRSEIWEHVYDFPDDSLSNVVDVYVGYLRKKIEVPGAPKLIHTRRGKGYVLGETS